MTNNTNTKRTFKSGDTFTSTCLHTGQVKKYKLGLVEKHPDNVPFKKLIDNIDSLKEQFPDVSFNMNVINCSLVQKGKTHILREHNSLEIFFAESTLIRISPFKDGFEITKIIVNKEIRGKGIGVYIMESMFLMCVLSGIDLSTLPIMLECTGQTGIEKSSIQQQCKFFRKFGFRVDQKVSRYDGESGYVQMYLVNDLLKEYFVNKANNKFVESK